MYCLVYTLQTAVFSRLYIQAKSIADEDIVQHLNMLGVCKDLLKCRVSEKKAFCEYYAVSSERFY